MGIRRGSERRATIAGTRAWVTTGRGSTLTRDREVPWFSLRWMSLTSGLQIVFGRNLGVDAGWVSVFAVQPLPLEIETRLLPVPS